MAERAIAAQKAADSSPRQFSRGESRKLVTDDGRRNRFKGRGKDLERGISAPSLFSDDKAAPKAPMPLTEEEAVTVGLGLGHDFAKKTFFQPTYCHYCSELLWGLRSQGYMCKGMCVMPVLWELLWYFEVCSSVFLYRCNVFEGSPGVQCYCPQEKFTSENEH